MADAAVATTDDGYTWVEKEVTRKGKTYKQWYRVKVGKAKSGVAKLAKLQAKGPTIVPPAPVTSSLAEQFMGVKPLTPAENILKEKIGGQLGSNAGGTYQGADGIKRYVKFYDNPDQAYGEVLSNRIYADLHKHVPHTETFEHEGKVAIASDLREGAKLSKSLTKENAQQFMKGFAVDVLTANWDAAGLTFDNSLTDKSGNVYRIDQGGSLLRRASGKLKPESVLDDIPEWTGLFSPNMNPSYSKVAALAGVTKAEQLGDQLKTDLAAIQKLEKRHGDWAGYIKATVPELANHPAEAARMAQMLTARTKLLADKVDSIPPGDPGVGFKYVQKSVTRKGVVTKKWVKVKDEDPSALIKAGVAKLPKVLPPPKEQKELILKLQETLKEPGKYGPDLSPENAQMLRTRATKVYANLTGDQQLAISAFTGSEYRLIRAVQSGKTFKECVDEGLVYAGSNNLYKSAVEHVKSLPDAQAALTITDPTQYGTLHRGMKMKEEVLYQLLHSEELTHNGFSTNSTSYSKLTAESFAGSSNAAYADDGERKYPVVIQYLKVKQGAVFMYAQNGNAMEREVALGKGNFKITGRRYNDKGYFEFDVLETD